MKLLVVRVLLIVSSLSVLIACGEDPEKAAFRKALVEKALNDDTRKAGNAFLLENQQKPDVVTLPSGLQYKVLSSSAEGKSPTMAQAVVVQYEGTRVDGGVFDSSYARGKPSTFPLKGVIKGWQEALLKMKTGDVWMIYIPADLAYGATSPSEGIPANSALVFKVELMDVVDAE